MLICTIPKQLNTYKKITEQAMNNVSYFPTIAMSVGVLVDALWMQFYVTLNPI